MKCCITCKREYLFVRRKNLAGFAPSVTVPLLPHIYYHYEKNRKSIVMRDFIVFWIHVFDRMW